MRNGLKKDITEFNATLRRKVLEDIYTELRHSSEIAVEKEVTAIMDLATGRK